MTRIVQKIGKKLYKGSLLGVMVMLAFFLRFQDGEHTEAVIDIAHADDTTPGGSGGGSGPSDGSGPSGCSGGCGSDGSPGPV